MTIRFVIALSAAATLCVGCATGYVSASTPVVGIFGGYWDTKGPGELIKVGFSGNALSDKRKVGLYLAYHCAEIVQREGKNYFALYENLPAAVTDHRSSDKAITTVTGKPTAYVYILPFDGPAPNLLSAQELLTRLKPEVEHSS